MSYEPYHKIGKDVPATPRQGREERGGEHSIGNVVNLRDEFPSVPDDRQARPTATPEENQSQEEWLFVLPGEYTVGFVEAKKAKMWNRMVWHIKMKIVDPGEYFGKVIQYPVNALPRGHRPTPGWYICSAFAIGTDRRPPKDLWRLRPESFLSGCQFVAAIRTITKDSLGVELPEAAHKSRVACLRERVAGTPPYISGKRG